jgi:hypothetical protein
MPDPDVLNVMLRLGCPPDIPTGSVVRIKGRGGTQDVTFCCYANTEWCNILVVTYKNDGWNITETVPYGCLLEVLAVPNT